MTFDAQNRIEKPLKSNRKKSFPFSENPLPSIYGNYPKSNSGTNPLYQWGNRTGCLASNRNTKKKGQEMRTVLRNHNEVAHVWAQQNQHHGRSNNMFFYGKSIYSYGEHYTLAKFQSNGVVLINSERYYLGGGKYSNSTSKHSSIVRSAIPSETVTFTVPNTGSEREERNDLENVSYYAKSFRENLEKASKARKHYAFHLTQAKVAKYTAIEYCESFDCQDLLERFDFDFDFEADDVKDKIKAIRIREAKRKAEKLAKLKAEMSEKVVQWREGKKVWISSYPDTLLRVIDDGKTVETSKGAYFPASQAKRAIRFVKSVMKSGKAWQRNGERFELGNYQLDSVSTVGTVRAGCHVVKFDEIERLKNSFIYPEGFEVPAIKLKGFKDES